MFLPNEAMPNAPAPFLDRYDIALPSMATASPLHPKSRRCMGRRMQQ
jgi:hypothetical protein